MPVPAGPIWRGLHDRPRSGDTNAPFTVAANNRSGLSGSCTSCRTSGRPGIVDTCAHDLPSDVERAMSPSSEDAKRVPRVLLSGRTALTFRAYGPPVSSHGCTDGPDVEQPARTAAMMMRNPSLVIIPQCISLSLAILDRSFR